MIQSVDGIAPPSEGTPEDIVFRIVIFHNNKTYSADMIVPQKEPQTIQNVCKYLDSITTVLRTLYNNKIISDEE